jgi:carbamoyltransferase
MKILGISAYYHDSAAALLIDGDLRAAAHEERFSRKKHDARFPVNAIAYCLSEAGLHLADLDAVVYYEKPLIKFERLLETYLAFAPRGFRSFMTSMPSWIKDKLFLRRELVAKLRAVDPAFDPLRLKFSEHHLSHAASAFFPSPFDKAIILTCDGVGEWSTTSLGLGEGASLRMDKEIRFPHSLGLLYSAFTYYCGFKVNSGEYKLMGLAPYGEPKYVQKILDNLIDVKEDGSFRLNLAYFDYCTGLTMTGKKFDELWGRPPLSPEDKPDAFYLDLAASIQEVTEQILIKMVRAATQTYGRLPLVMAGGVALNCVANGRFLAEKLVDDIWIQPAAGDAGGALGAALAYAVAKGETIAKKKGRDAMQGCYLGPLYDEVSIEKDLQAAGVVFTKLQDEAALIESAAQDLANGKALGWHQGRGEYGPRALGDRSILADPRDPKMQTELNLKIKFRESFRPFAPSVLAEDCADWFTLAYPSPYMLLVADVQESKLTKLTEEQKKATGLERQKVVRSQIPAITHVDNSARVQTIHKETNPLYHALVSRFKDLTGCPLVVNTSFNIRGEPIVETPADAVRCFLGTNIDRLYVGRFLMRKEDQPSALLKAYTDAVEKD